MDFEDLMSRFAVAFGVGLVIGLERGWRAREERAGGRLEIAGMALACFVAGGVALWLTFCSLQCDALSAKHRFPVMS